MITIYYIFFYINQQLNKIIKQFTKMSAIETKEAFNNMIANVNDKLGETVDVYVQEIIMPQIENNFKEIISMLEKMKENPNEFKWKESIIYLMSESDAKIFNSHFDHFEGISKINRRVIVVPNIYYWKICSILKESNIKCSLRMPYGYGPTKYWNQDTNVMHLYL